MDSQTLPMEPPAIPLGGAEDRISALPDELLHTILVRLQSASAAARTSVLSYRWRGVWAHMPELVLGGSRASAMTPLALLNSIDAALNSYDASALHSLLDSIDAAAAARNSYAAPTLHSLLDSIDAALNSYAAPTLRSLNIDLSGFDRHDVLAHRISSWLRFASQRIAGKLRLHLRLRHDAQIFGHNMEELVLPICERAKEIDIYIMNCNVFLRPPPTGSFSLLTDLDISCDEMDGAELGRVVSSLQCPRLQKLRLFVLMLKPVRDISISSESLQCLDLSSCTGKLEVTAPMLQEIIVRSTVEACIVVAPKLEKVTWFNTYDPCRHQFIVAGRDLRSLSISHSSTSSTQLMERFDTTSELAVHLGLMRWDGIAEYTTFLKEMEKLPICETLVVNSLTNHHAFAPMVLHLLKGCSCIRKFKLILNRYAASELPSCTMPDCPCHLPENYCLDDITFSSLEEIEISRFAGTAEQVEFVELLLSRCNTVTTLKKVDFTVPFVHVPSEIMEVVQSISSMCHPNSTVQFNVHARAEPEP